MASTPLLRLSLPLHRHHQKPTAPLLPHPLKPRLPSPRKLSRPLPKPTTTSTTCSYTPIPATDRLISAASFFLPFFNGLQYGRFLFMKYPIIAIPFEPLVPLLSLYHSLPYASFITFFGLYLGVVRNPSLSQYVRFNAMQALVLDVLLAVPALLQRIISPGQSGIGLKLTAWFHTGVFVIVVASFVYGLAFSVLGKTPYLPFIAEAAGRQMD